MPSIKEQMDTALAAQECRTLTLTADVDPCVEGMTFHVTINGASTCQCGENVSEDDEDDWDDEDDESEYWDDEEF